MNKLKELFVKYKEILLYLIFGGLTTVVSWGTYIIFVKYMGMAITPGKALSWVCAVLFAFVTNKLWVFESKSWAPKTAIRELVSFFGARAATGALEIFGVPALVKLGMDQQVFGTDGMLANIVVSVVVVILNYVFSKLLIFRKSKKDAAEEAK